MLYLDGAFLRPSLLVLFPGLVQMIHEVLRCSFEPVSTTTVSLRTGQGLLVFHMESFRPHVRRRGKADRVVHPSSGFFRLQVVYPWPPPTHTIF